MAEQIALALRGRDHQVFFDRDSLTVSAEFHQRIQQTIDESEFLIFLISAAPVQRGSYALTELKAARQKWPHPKDHVLPVVVRAVNWDEFTGCQKSRFWSPREIRQRRRSVPRLGLAGWRCQIGRVM